MNATQLNVQGMSCPSCVRHITAALQEIDGVETVDVRLREKTVKVTHRMPLDTSELTRALAEAGYEAELAG